MEPWRSTSHSTMEVCSSPPTAAAFFMTKIRRSHNMSSMRISCRNNTTMVMSGWTLSSMFIMMMVLCNTVELQEVDAFGGLPLAVAPSPTFSCPRLFSSTADRSAISTRLYSVDASSSQTSTPASPSKPKLKPKQNNNNRNNSNRSARSNNNNFRQRNNNNNHRSSAHRNSNSNNDPALLKAKALNQKIIASTSPTEVLATFLQSGAARGTAGDSQMNSVNFSTSMHRIAKTCTTVPENQYNLSYNERQKIQQQLRTSTLTDPRFAILLCALTEAFVEKRAMFNCRELSNISWALAKMQFVPHQDDVPLLEDQSEGNMDRLLAASSMSLRKTVLEAGQHRATNNDVYISHQRIWISTMRTQMAYLMDAINRHVRTTLLGSFKSQELANLLWAEATVGRGEAVFFDSLVTQLLENNHVLRCKPQELSNSIWAFATAGIRGKGQIGLIHYIAQATSEGSFLEQFKPQELSNTAWGIATVLSKRGDSENCVEEDKSAFQTLSQVANELLERIEYFKPQEVSNTMWAMATVGFEDKILLDKVLQRTAVDVLPRLRRFSPQELNMLGWSFARLVDHTTVANTEEVDTLFRGIGQEVIRRLRYFSPQDVGTTLWSFATMGYTGASVGGTNMDDVFHLVASRLRVRDGQTFKPQELSNSIWALATAGITPLNVHVFDTSLFSDTQKDLLGKVMNSNSNDRIITECFMTVAHEVLRRPWAFKDQELKDVLWAFSKAGVRHPHLFKFVAEHLVGSSSSSHVRGLSGFNPQGVGNLAWSYARQAQLSNDVASSGQNKNDSSSSFSNNSNGRLAVYETICIDIGEDLVNRLFAALAEASLNQRDGLTMFKPQDMSNTVWAFATLGLLHREFFEAVAGQVLQRVSSKPQQKGNRSLSPTDPFKPQEISNLIWSFATLNYHPEQSSMLHAISPYIVRICSSSSSYDIASISKWFTRQELANLAWSCAVLEEYPPDLMPLLYTGLLGSSLTATEEDVKQLNEIYGDQGLQKAAIMSLLYVQMAVTMEAPELNLNLPDNFLEVWSEKHENPQLVDNDASLLLNKLGGKISDNNLITLSTSRLQTSVSKAFGRIGFAHVEEHVLGSDEISKDYGIKLISAPLDFLSIDIANIEDRIGVEVDGPAHFINVLDDILTKTNADDGSSSSTGGTASQIQPKERDGRMKRLRDGKMWLFQCNGRRQINGPSALKHRLLSQLGWRIIHLPFWEWNNLNNVVETENVYCNDLLDEVAVE